MNKHYLLLPFCLAAGTLFAQPTLTLDDLIKVGDVVITQPTDSSVFNPGSAGANQTWDFSQLQPVGAPDTTFYVAPATTPYSADYPQSNIAAFYDGNVYGYYKADANQLLYYGQKDPTTTLILTDPAVFLVSPVTYGSTSTDNIAGSVIVSAFPGSVSGNVFLSADGYGALQTPGAAYFNVLRIKTVTAAQVTIPFLGTLLDTTINYSWYQVGIKTPVLEMIRNVQWANASLIDQNNYTNYYLSLTTSAQTPSEASGPVQAVPNPAHDRVQFSGLPGRSELVISSIGGQTVRRQIIAPGESVEVAGLAPGLYVCLLQTAGMPPRYVKLMVK